MTACCVPSQIATALERHQRVIERERGAYVDALTNLPNRASLDVALERLSRTQPSAWAVLILDLDNLNPINDTLGHAAGDALLQAVASRLAESVAPDRVFRMGGDEFAVILQRAGAPAGIEGTARHILDTLAVPALILARATIGGAVLSAGNVDAKSVRQNADFALYHAKETSRGGFVLYAPGIGSAIKTRIEVIRDVDAALREGRVDAFYQPILRLDTRAIVGIEALCRLRKPDGEVGCVSPGDLRCQRRLASDGTHDGDRRSGRALVAGSRYSVAACWHQHYLGRFS